MDRLTLYKDADFGADKETWLFLQGQSQILQSLTAIVGHTYILSGLEGADTLSDGYIVYRGDLLPFTGGAKQSDCHIVTEVTAADYRIDDKGDGEYDRKPTYTHRYACFSTRVPEKKREAAEGESFPFSDLKPFRQLLDLQRAATPIGGIMLWSGALTAIPDGWYLCDGTEGTPDLRDRFVIGAGHAYPVADQGGAREVVLNTSQLPAHKHRGTVRSAGDHSHRATTARAGYHNHSGTTHSAGSHNHGYYGAADHGHHIGMGGRRLGVAYQYTNYAGSHSHGLSINSAGSHSHSVTIDRSGGHTHSLSLGYTGGGQAHENRPPYYALAYIMFRG